MVLESGPFKFTVENGNAKLTENPFGFHNKANILFFDNPTGAGFSYTNKPFGSVTAIDAGKDMVASLKIFFGLFPEFKNNEFYAFGESYGGKYVISLATLLAKEPTINLKGIALGNSWVVPVGSFLLFKQKGHSTKSLFKNGIHHRFSKL
jgi:carboxypeptidase C (cathepsin A)